MHTAASTFSRLCAPFSEISLTGRMLCSRLPSRQTICFASHESAALDLAQAAEPVDATTSLLRHRDAGWVIGIQHREIILRLVLEDSRLRGRVVLKAVMAVEVVGRDVQDDCNLGAEALNASPAESC